MTLPMAVAAQTSESARKLRLPGPLLLLLAVTFLLGLAWAAATPPLQGPDEEAHLGYVQYLAETGNAPSGVGPGTPDSREVVVARTAYGLRRLIGNVSARPAWGASLHEEFTHADRANGSGGNPMAKNPPLYYAYEAVPYWAFHRASVVERQLWMRVASVLLGVLTVALTWLIAAELTAREWVRFTAAAAFALHPQLSFITATINPDALLVALTTAFVLAAVRVLRRGPSVAWMAGLGAAGGGRGGAPRGAAAGAAAFTQGRGSALVPAAVVVVALAVVCSRSPRYAVAAAVPLAALLLAAVAAAPDDELRQNTAAASFHARQFLEYAWQFYLPRLGFMH